LLVCGEGLHHTTMARVVCLNRNTGETLWTFRTNGHVECTPAIHAGRVYVGAGDDGVYCLKLDPAVRDEQRLVWHAPGTSYPDAETSLAVAGDRVYVGLGIGGEAICCLDANDGTELGRIDLPFPVFSPPCIDRGKLYIGMGVGDYLTPMKDPAGQVCCIDLDRWELEWSFPTPATVRGAIVAVDDQLLFGCGDGSVYAISPQGHLLRTWQSYAPIIASPAVAAGRVYVVNQDGVLYGLNRRTLQPLWQCRLGPAGRYVSSPTVAGDSVIVGTEHDRLLRVGRASAVQSLPVWPGYLGGAGAGGSVGESALPCSGHFHWSYLPSVDGHSAMVAPAALTNDCVLVPFSGAGRGLACLDLPSKRSDPPIVRWFLPAAHDVVTSPAISGRTGFFVDGAMGESDRGLHAVDLESGKPLWQVPVDPACHGALTVDDAGVLIQMAPKLSLIHI
jgi:outer membrane protein assembly factor BamB